MKKALPVLAIAFIAFTSAPAQVLTWDVQGDNNPATLPADFIDVNLSENTGFNTVTRVGVTQSGAANNAFSSNNWNLGAFNESDKYITFSLQADPGFSVTLTDLQYVISGSNTAPGTGNWGYSIGGGSFVLQPAFSISAANSLATWDFADFTTDQAVEFRFWAYGATSVTGGAAASTGVVRIGNVAGNDLILAGQAIPEPSTLGLIGFGLLGAWAFGRRIRG